MADPGGQRRNARRNSAGLSGDSNNIYVALSDVAFKAPQSSGGPAQPRVDPEKGGGIFAPRLATGARAWRAAAISCAGREVCSPD